MSIAKLNTIIFNNKKNNMLWNKLNYFYFIFFVLFENIEIEKQCFAVS